MDRLISLILVIICFVLIYTCGLFSSQSEQAAKDTFYMVLFALFSLALIWFGDTLGEFTGVVRGGYIGTKTPGCLVKFMGWLFFLTFVAITVLRYIQHTSPAPK